MTSLRCWCSPTVRQIVVGCQQLATALVAAHSKGIVHHDVRAGNVLVSTDEDFWLLADFGNAAPTTVGNAADILSQAL